MTSYQEWNPLEVQFPQSGHHAGVEISTVHAIKAIQADSRKDAVLDSGIEPGLRNTVYDPARIACKWRIVVLLMS